MVCWLVVLSASIVGLTSFVNVASCSQYINRRQRMPKGNKGNVIEFKAQSKTLKVGPTDSRKQCRDNKSVPLHRSDH